MLDLDLKGAGTNLVMQYAMSRLKGENRKQSAKQAGLGLAAGVVLPSDDVRNVRNVVDAVKVFRTARGKVRQLEKDVETPATFDYAVGHRKPTLDDYDAATTDIENLESANSDSVREVISELTQLEESIVAAKRDLILMYNEMSRSNPSTSAKDLI